MHPLKDRAMSACRVPRLTILHLSLSTHVSLGKGYADLIPGLPWAPSALAKFEAAEESQVEASQPKSGASNLKGNSKRETRRDSKSDTVKAYRGVSRTGPNRYRAQICNRGKVRHMLRKSSTCRIGFA